MGISQERKLEIKALLAGALIPPRYFNVSLTHHGEPGNRLRQYLLSDYANDASEKRGLFVVCDKPGLAQSFARELVITGASSMFYYLQTFASRWPSLQNLTQSYVIEWFEQSVEHNPFSPMERFQLETRFSEHMDDGIMFYLFSPIHPRESTWWSKQMITTIEENCRIIEVASDGNRRGGKGTDMVNRKTQGQKNAPASKRVSIR